MTEWPAWATETVEVQPPNPAWPANGEGEREALQTSLAPWLVAPVEHVGSTAVPALVAKPILDLQAAVANFDGVPLIAKNLASSAGTMFLLNLISGRGGDSSPR